MKSCRTQGDFRSSCLKKWMRCYSGLTKGLHEPRLRSEKADVRPENVNRKLEIAGPENLDLRSERPGLRPERLDLRPERSDLKPEGPDERGMDKRMNKWTDRRMNISPPVLYRTLSSLEPLPKD